MTTEISTQSRSRLLRGRRNQATTTSRTRRTRGFFDAGLAPSVWH